MTFNLLSLLALPDTVFQLIISHEPNTVAASLHQVNRAFRAAVARTVATVSCRQQGPQFTSELAEVFPHADRLRVTFPVRTHGPKIWEFWEYLEFIVDTCPALVSKVVAVDFELGSVDTTAEDLVPSLTDFLSRCVCQPQFSLCF
jgi:hypothetical protein